MAEELNLVVNANLKALDDLKKEASKTGQSVAKSMQQSSQQVSSSMQRMSNEINKNLNSSIASITKTQLGFTALAYGITRMVSSAIKELSDLEGEASQLSKPFDELGETLDTIKNAFNYLIINALTPIVEELNSLTKEIGLTNEGFQDFADTLVNIISQAIQIVIKQISILVDVFKIAGNTALLFAQALQNIKGNTINPALVDIIKNIQSLSNKSQELTGIIAGTTSAFNKGTITFKEYNEAQKSLKNTTEELGETTSNAFKTTPLEEYIASAIEVGDAVRNLDDLYLELADTPDPFDEDDIRITEELKERLQELQQEYRQLESVFEGLGNVLDTTLNQTLLKSNSLVNQLAGAFLKFSFDLIKRKVIETKASEITATGSAIEAASKTAASTGNIFLLPAFITLATGFISSAFGNIKSFASGGIVSGSTLSITGEYPNAVNNPEVIAPLSKLKEYLGNDNINLTGQFQVDGQDLILAIDRAREIEAIL